ncbi:MAG: flagellar hook-length control protein FliK [Planctomycetaceae bacterium]|nr:flagellar hook-length control protein FliK [Planctomycetaceae bacterium]
MAGAVRSAPQNGQQLRVRLYPPHLGAMQIEVTSNNGTLSVRMEVQSVAAQSALSDNMSALREALVQQGNSLDRIDVQLVETNAEEGRADLTDEQQQQQQAEEQSGEESEEQSAEVEAEDNQVPSSVGNGLDELDIQV